MKLNLSNAPCSWGVEFADNPTNPNWSTVLDEIHAAGYAATELGPLGYLPTDTNRLKEELNKRNLKIIAGTLFQHLHDYSKREDILRFTKQSCETLQALDAKYMVVIDHVASPRTDQAGQKETATRLNKDDWAVMMETIRQASRICIDHGITPTLHAHTGTFIEYQDELDRAMSDLDEDLVSLCIDTGHCFYAGIKPEDAIAQYQNRIKYIHFKDINPSVHQAVVNKGIDFYSAISNGIFCPLGQGGVNFPAVREALTATDYQGWITVEQDMDPAVDNNPLQNAINSRQFIEKHFLNN